MSTTLHVDDVAVREAVEAAARAACEALDAVFPGSDNRATPGITSNFQGMLEDVLRQMLSGYDPLSARKGYFTTLPSLVLTDRSFGNPNQPRGDGFVVVAPKRVRQFVVRGEEGDPDLALNDGGTQFVPLDTPDAIDPFAAFEAAVQGAVRYIAAHGLPMRFVDATGQYEAALPEVRAVFWTHTGRLSLEPPPCAAAA